MILVSYNHISERWYLSYGGTIVGKKKGYPTRAKAIAAKTSLNDKGK